MNDYLSGIISDLNFANMETTNTNVQVIFNMKNPYSNRIYGGLRAQHSKGWLIPHILEELPETRKDKIKYFLSFNDKINAPLSKELN
jgi:hypothetical protein